MQKVLTSRVRVGSERMDQVGLLALAKGIREASGWTQEKLAQEIGVALSTVNGRERGKRTHQNRTLSKRLQKIAEAHSYE